MKKNNHFFRVTGIITCCLLFLFACKKDNNIKYSQRPASKNLFLSISGTGNLNRTQQISTQSTSAASSASVGLNLTLAVSSNITATVGLDTAKVKPYNVANGTQYHLLPASSYQLVAPANGLIIKAGSLFSADSVKINFTNLKGLRGSNYLLPLSITSETGDPSVILSDSVKTMYLLVTLTDVTQPTVSLSASGGTLTSLSYPVGQKGAAAATPITINVSPASPNNIMVTTGVDTTLVSKYGSGYTQFPAGSYTLSPSATAVAAGQVSSVINVNIPDLTKFDGTKTYLLPVSITSVTGDDYALTGNKTVYLKLSFNNLNNSNNTSPGGTSLISQQGWTATASSYFDGSIYGGAPYPASNAIDGNVNTDWIGYDSNPNIVIDMGTPHNIKTIAYNKAVSNILVNFGYDSYPSSVNVYTSTDGTNWANEGTYQPFSDGGSGSSNPGVNYINFYNAIPARYIKLVLPTYFNGFAEVNVYQ